MQNFDPKKLLDEVAALGERVAVIAASLAPFLPSPVGTAINDVEAVVADVQKLRDFVVTEYPQLQAMLGTAGVGAAQAGGIIAEDMQRIESGKVGTFSQLPPSPAVASEHPDIAGAGAALNSAMPREEAKPNPDVA